MIIRTFIIVIAFCVGWFLLPSMSLGKKPHSDRLKPLPAIETWPGWHVPKRSSYMLFVGFGCLFRPEDALFLSTSNLISLAANCNQNLAANV